MLTAVEIDSKFKQAVQGYKGESVESYVALKRSLRGLLIVNTESTENIKSFLNAEEKRLSTAAGYQLDFDELLRIKIAEEGEAKPGLASRIFSAIDPANWSEKTVQRWRVGLAALQLSANLLENYQKIQQAPGSPEPSLPAEKQELLDKESAFLGVLLSDKYQAIKNRAILETFTQKMPALGPILKAVLEHYPNAPTASERTQIMSSYRTERHQALLHGAAMPDQGERVFKSAAQAEKTERAAAVSLSALLPCAERKAEALQSLQTASATLEKSQRVLHECRAIEYLFPSIESCPASLQKLKEEVAQLQRALRETMTSLPKNESPVPSLVDWSEGVKKQCFEVKDLEKRIADAMLNYQDSMATSLKQGDSALDRFGNKHKNIVKQANLVDALGLEGIIVPGPRGISSDQVLQFLTVVAPEIFDHWKALGTLHASYQGGGPFLESADAASHLKSMQEGIEKAFAKASSDDNAFRALGLSKEIKDWLADMRSHGNYLMVRSTGAEDSRKHANAGGNDSIAYVAPTIPAFCDALGKVVRSYFGFSSLQNRLNADINPFEEALKMAVTVQELIGEPIGGTNDLNQIPISLVLFSNEPLYFGEETFRVMRISATYGHGEGVVGNKGISADTALILQSRSQPDQLYILYDNQLKPTRLAPVENQETDKITLEALPNSLDMANRPALNKDLLIRLYEWGVIGEKFFDDTPSDMEIIVKGGKIYPVQAKPVNRPRMLPTYLDLKKVEQAKENPIEKTLYAEMIVSGMASVVEIALPEEILMAETLEKAQELYRKGQHKLIVVAQPELANTHPVVNFSSLGVPCVYAKDYSAAQEMVKQIGEHHRIAVCLQSASLSLWDIQNGSIEAFQSTGFVVHPAKVAISLPSNQHIHEQMGIFPKAPQDVKDLLLQIRTSATSQSALMLLQTLQDHELIKTFQRNLENLENQVAEDPKLKQVADPVIEVAHALSEKLYRAFAEVQAILQKSYPEHRLELLLNIKVLETLLFQSPTSENALGQHSILKFEKIFAATESLISYQKQLPHAAHFADLLLDGTRCPINEVFEDWKDYLLSLEPIAQSALQGQTTGLTLAEIVRFKTSLQTLRNANVLPLFFTFFFVPFRDKSPIEALREINQLIPTSDESLIEQLVHQKQSIDQIKANLGKFAEPKDFPEVWKRLQKIAAEFDSETHPLLKKAKWDATPLLIRSIALQTMEHLVDVYDLAIKTMKASQTEDSTEQTKKFQEMLGPFLELLDDWATELVGEEGFVTHPSWPLLKYLEILSDIYNPRPLYDYSIYQLLAKISHKLVSYSWKLNDLIVNPFLLLSPSDFSVSAAMLGSRTDFEKHLPRNLEDVWTLTHQNLIATSSVLTKTLFSEDQIAQCPLPNILKQALQYIPSIGGEIFGRPIGNPQLIGIDVDSVGITFHFNVAMKDHSGKFDLHFDRERGRLSMECQFLGVNSRQRWQEIAESAEILDCAGVLPLLTKPKLTAQEFTCSFDITENQSMETAVMLFQIMAESTYVKQSENIKFIQLLKTSTNLEETARFIESAKLHSTFAKLTMKYITGST